MCVLCREGLPCEKRWVDEYVQAFYFTEQSDVMDWVLQRREAYTLRQARNLLSHGVGAKMRKKKLREGVAQLEAVFGVVPTN